MDPTQLFMFADRSILCSSYKALCAIKHILVVFVILVSGAQLYQTHCDALGSSLNILLATLIEATHVACEKLRNGYNAEHGVDQGRGAGKNEPH